MDIVDKHKVDLEKLVTAEKKYLEQMFEKSKIEGIDKMLNEYDEMKPITEILQEESALNSNSMSLFKRSSTMNNNFSPRWKA